MWHGRTSWVGQWQRQSHGPVTHGKRTGHKVTLAGRFRPAMAGGGGWRLNNWFQVVCFLRRQSVDRQTADRLITSGEIHRHFVPLRMVWKRGLQHHFCSRAHKDRAFKVCYHEKHKEIDNPGVSYIQ